MFDIESEALIASKPRKSQRMVTWRDTVGFCWTNGRDTTPAVATKSTLFVFSPCLLSSPAWPRHSYQSTSLSSDTAFCLPALASPPLCLPNLLQSPTRLQHWDLRVSVATSCLLDQSCRLLRRDPLSGASLY